MFDLLMIGLKQSSGKARKCFAAYISTNEANAFSLCVTFVLDINAPAFISIFGPWLYHVAGSVTHTEYNSLLHNVWYLLELSGYLFHAIRLLFT